jgi:hypothetical protein
VAELISSGPAEPGGPGTHRRPPAWLVVVVIAAGLIGAIRLWGGVSAPRDAPASPADLGPITPVPAPAPSGPAGEFSMRTRPGQIPRGMRLLIGPAHYGSPRARQRIAIVNDAGQTEPVDTLPIQSGQSVVLDRAPGATTVILQDERQAPIGAYVLPDAGGSISLGHDLDTIIPARGGGYFAADTGWAGAGRLVRFAADGRRGWERGFAPPTQIIRDTPYGLLVNVLSAKPNGTSGALRLVDPESGTVRHTLGAAGLVLAATDRRVAWIPSSCLDFPGQCSLVVTELDTRYQSEYAMPDGHVPSAAAFSPSQDALALSFPGTRDLEPGQDPDGFVAVQSMTSNEFRRMAGLSTEVKQSARLTWLGRDILLAVHDPDGHDRLLRWDRSADLPLLLPPQLPDYSAAAYLAAMT